MIGPSLLIRLGSLGDVVLATAAAQALAEPGGEASVDVLVKREWAPLWRGHPAVRDVLEWPGEPGQEPGLRAWARRLRARGYVETVDLQNSLRTRMLTAWAGLSPVRRPRRFGRERRNLVLFKRWGPPADFSMGRSFVDAARMGARALPAVYPGEDARAKAAGLIPEPGVRVGLVPGAMHDTKRWPMSRFVAVGRALAETGRGPVPVFFGPREDDLLREWEAAWPRTQEWSPVREDLPGVAACFERLASVLVNDTGLMHLGAAVGTPVVALFGPTVRSFGFAPLGSGHQVLEVEGLWCRPCTRHGGRRCPLGHFHCMNKINTSRVIDAVNAAPRPAPVGRDQSPPALHQRRHRHG